MTCKLFINLVFIFLFISSCSKHKAPDNQDVTLESPAGFKIEVLDAQSFQLSWKNPKSNLLQAVKIYRSLDKHPSQPSEGVLIYQGMAENFVDNKLNTGHRYYYSIFAYYSNGAFSDRVSANALPFDLLLLRNFVIEKKIGSIFFKWEKPYDVHYNGIRIVRSKDAYPQTPLEGELVYEGSLNNFEDGLDPQKPLAKETDYFYSFFSFNENKKYSLKAYQLKAFCWSENSFSVRVGIDSPLENSVLNHIITIKATAETLLFDTNHISKTEFYIDGQMKQTLLSVPFEYNWDTSAYNEGTHIITVISYNSKGISGSKSISVILDKTPPNVSFIVPAENSLAEGIVKITGQAADLNGVKRVDLYLDNVLIESDLKAPYIYYFPTNGMQVEGSHVFTLKAYDFAGNEGSVNRTVIVNNRPFISAVAPADLSENISYTSEVSVTFSEPIIPVTADSNSFFVKKETGQIISGAISYQSASKTLFFKPDSYFEPNTKYIVEVAAQIQDLTGLIISAPKTWSFITSVNSNIFDDPGALFDSSTFAD